MSSADKTPTPYPSAGSGSADLAPWMGNLDQQDFDVEFYERLLDRQPTDVRLLRLLGELYARKGRHAQALEVDRKLIELAPHDCTVHYNLSCSLAMQGQAEQAVGSLARALELGYNDYEHLEVDPELDSLRQLPQFRALLSRYGLSA